MKIKISVVITLVAVVLAPIAFYKKSTKSSVNMVGKSLKLFKENPQLTDANFDPKKYTLYIRWESWSPQGMMSLSAVNIIHREMTSKVNVIGVYSHWNEGIEEIRKARIVFPLLFDQGMQFDQIFTEKKVPYFVLLNPNQVVIWQSESIEQKELEQLIFNYERR